MKQLHRSLYRNIESMKNATKQDELFLNDTHVESGYSRKKSAKHRGYFVVDWQMADMVAEFQEELTAHQLKHIVTG